MKKLLSILALSLMLITPMFAAPIGEGSVILTTFVAENINNTGIKVTADTEDIMATFDSKFFAATDSLTIENTLLDNSTNEVTGSFSILVRRASGLPTNVTVTAGTLKHTDTTDVLAYTLTGTDTNISVTTLPVTATTYVIPAVATGVMRYQNIITYTITDDIDARAGNYSANITFTITT
jgi:hypothetical protein